MEFILTGDALFSSQNLAKTIDPQLVERLRGADAVFTNAEFVTPRLNTAPAAGRGYQTSVRPDRLDELAALNIRYVSFANNHTGDYGVEGILDTLEEARKRGIVPLGVAENLYNARKPVFINHQDCRVALITIDVTRSEVFAAVDAANGIAARPGVNPLRWGRHYAVTPEDLKTLTAIAERIGIAKSMETAKKIELWQSKETREQLLLGSYFEGNLSFVAADRPGVETYSNQKDLEAILNTITDAAYRSDFVFVNLHTHEGKEENWYHDYAADFIEAFAHQAVEAGANVVFGHGAHFTRGIERYQDGVIFYNLGSLLMEFEAGESLLSSEMNEAYGYDAAELPATLHKNRAQDSDGNWQGFYSHPKFAQNFLVSFQLERGHTALDFSLIPTDLQLTDPFVTRRGLPVWASEEAAIELVNRLNAVSNDRYQTEIYEADGVFKVRPLTE